MEAITRTIREKIVNACGQCCCQCSTFDKFFRLQPPTFVGGTDPLVAEEWIGRMEKIFKFVHCSEEEKVQFATFMLKDDASYWWDFTCLTLKNKVGENNPIIGWEDFKTMFLDKYFPEFMRTFKGDEFQDLRQGTLTLAEYVRKFELLLRFAPFLVDTEEKKARRFNRGLRRHVAYDIEGRITYANALTDAHFADYLDKGIESESTNHSNRKRSFQYGNDCEL